MRSAFFLSLAAIAVFSWNEAAQAQAAAPTPNSPVSHEVDLALTYTAQQSNFVTDNEFWQQGGSLELAASVFKGFGAAADVTGTRVSGTDGSDSGLVLLSTTFGPRYTWDPRRNHRYAIFGQSLLGEAHAVHSIFPSPRGVQGEANTFALQVGGGLDIRLSDRLAIRPAQADWIRTQFPNGTSDIQNSLRIAGGLVFRLQR